MDKCRECGTDVKHGLWFCKECKPHCKHCGQPVTGTGRRYICAACADGWKWCNRCQCVKTLGEFKLPNGRRIGYCYPCYLERNRTRYRELDDVRLRHYTWHLRKKFGISRERANELAAIRECEVCGLSVSTYRDARKFLHVDHNHGTGKVRGVLCRRCNYALGLFEADRRLIGRLVDYLDRH